LAVQLSGPELKDPGTRAAPSLRYLRERITDNDNVPTSGFGWDGRTKWPIAT
jgi:cytochrome c peroxidase